MQYSGIGDLASAFLSQKSNYRIKTELHRFSQELASGTTNDVSAKSGGDLSGFASTETALKRLAAFKTSASEAAQFTDVLQVSLSNIQDTTSEIAPSLILAASTNEATLLQATASDARERFSAVISALNTSVGDRSILSGTEFSAKAVSDSETILAELKTLVAAETTAAGVEAIVTAWFDDVGGGFETNGYLGNTTDIAPFQIGENDKTALNLRADNQKIRDLLKGYALASLVSDDVLSGNHEERVALMSRSGETLISADHGLASLRAQVGSVQSRIENAHARNSAEFSALEITRSEILAVDPFETATKLTAAETQLQMMFTITARLSRLNLTEYLR